MVFSFSLRAHFVIPLESMTLTPLIPGGSVALLGRGGLAAARFVGGLPITKATAYTAMSSFSTVQSEISIIATAYSGNSLGGAVLAQQASGLLISGGTIPKLTAATVTYSLVVD